MPHSVSWTPGIHEGELRRDGVDRRYLVRVPSSLPAQPAPLLVELHGRGIDPARFDWVTGFGELAERKGFVLAMPSAIGGLWSDGRGPHPSTTEDVGFLAELVEELCDKLPVDPRRVYVTGMSNGATMTARFVCERSELIAAFAQVAGTCAVEVAERGLPSSPVPILHIHGDADILAPYAGGIRRKLRARLVLHRAYGPVVSVDEWARLWAESNRTVDGPRSSSIPPDVVMRRWSGNTPASDVAFFRIEGGGHTWPGPSQLPRFLFGRTSRTFDATAVIWSFLSAHTRAI
jgi:polyhydroxybutyrate depolymerase